MNGAIRKHITVAGTVQGVGFRPFVYRLAQEFGLDGWVKNTADDVTIEVQGLPVHVEQFLSKLQAHPPNNASVSTMRTSKIEPRAEQGFAIVASGSTGNGSTALVPDLAICDQCIADVYSPSSRYYQYAFTSCTDCGPRYSISLASPFDRKHSAMSEFELCVDCAIAYENPHDRRFHAQLMCCSSCGPELQLCDSDGAELTRGKSIVKKAANLLRDGGLLALKGLGGFQLICDATNSKAVARLRALKQRPAKPMAVMLAGEKELSDLCPTSAVQRALFLSPQAPIVVIDQSILSLAREVAPGLRSVGIMRATTALHHLLLKAFNGPVVVTSANRSGEPIITDDELAFSTLAGNVDCFLTHNRHIHHALDDSVSRIALGRPLLLRRARGYAPKAISINHSASIALGVGGHHKNTVALANQGLIELSAYLGDLDSLESVRRFRANVDELLDDGADSRWAELAVVHDWHPDYESTEVAISALAKDGTALPLQHHIAHICAVMADNRIEPPCFGVAWDGNGYGAAFPGDPALWGGEMFSLAEPGGCQRRVSLLGFPLAGGAQAIREPRRVALGLLTVGGEELRHHHSAALYCQRSFSNEELLLIQTMLNNKFNSPMSCSIGRLFDGIASLIGLCNKQEFEAQAASDLERQALDYLEAKNSETPDSEQAAYALVFRRCERLEIENTEHPLFRPAWLLDWRPLLKGVLDDLSAGKERAYIAYHFHYALARSIVDAAKMTQHTRVVLSGGCFQNVCLLELCVSLLEQQGFDVFWPRQLPANDGALSVGQAYAAQFEGLCGGPYYSRSELGLKCV